MGHPSRLNVGGMVAVRNGGVVETITAAAGNDGVEINGQGVDRLGYDSAVLAVLVRANLTASKTAAISLTIQESDDNSTFTDVAAEFQPGATAGGGVIATHSTTGDQHYVTEHNINLRGLKRYVRGQVTSDLSAGATDKSTVAMTWVLGGGDTLPV